MFDVFFDGEGRGREAGGMSLLSMPCKQTEASRQARGRFSGNAFQDLRCQGIRKIYFPAAPPAQTKGPLPQTVEVNLGHLILVTRRRTRKVVNQSNVIFFHVKKAPPIYTER